MAIPTPMSKVIPVNLDFNSSSTSNWKPFNTGRGFWTNDIGTAFLEFSTELDLTGTVASIVLENQYDKSLVQKTITEITSSPFYYQLGDEIQHEGRWFVQISVKKGEETIVSNSFAFMVNASVGHGKVERLVSIETFETLATQLTALQSSINDYLTTAQESEAIRISTYEEAVLAEQERKDAEDIRKEDDISRGATASSDHDRANADHSTAVTDHSTSSSDHGIAQTDHAIALADHTTALADHSTALSDHESYEGLLTDGVLTTNIENKLLYLESTYEPDLFSVKQQLADKAEQSALLVEKARIDSFTTLPTGSTTGDAELIDTRIGVDGVIYPNAGGAVREQLGVLFDTLSVEVVFDVLDKYIAVGGNGSLTGFIGYSLTSPMPCYFEKFYINDIFSGAYDVYSIGFYSNLPCDNTTFISGIVPSGIVNGYEAISVPLGANYMVFCAETSVIAAKTPYMFVPNNSTQSDIKALSSVNAAHAATFFDGVYLNEYGTKSYGLPWYSITEKIFLVPSLTYELDIKLAWGSFSVIAYFDADDAYIGSLQRTQFDAGAVYLTKHQITIPANCSYAIFTVPNDGKSTLKMTCGMSDFLSNVLSVNKTDDTLIIPKYIDVVKNHQCTIYRDCMVEYEEKSDYVAFYTFPFNNNAHSTELKNNCLSFTPTVTGEFDFRVMTLSENTYKVTSEKTVTVRTTDKASESTGLTKNIMMCGDSLIDANVPVDEVFNLLRADGDYTFNAIGTRGSAGSKHEGRGSWKWDTYLTQTTASGATNAFLYNGSLDFQQYCIDNGFDGIDYAIISLGTNDVGQGWHLLKDAEVATIIANAKTFLDALLSETTGFPNCKIALGLPAIGANTFGNPNMNKKWFIRGMQKLNKAYIDTFDNGSYHPNVTTVAHGLWTDREYSYLYENQTISNRIPETVKVHLDAIHPTVQGYKLWADAYYGKLRAFLAGYL